MLKPGRSAAGARQGRLSPAPELCVIVPVLNERDNVAPLVDKLEDTLDGIAWEVVFVDDGSTDGTRDVVASIGREDTRVRLLHRVGRRGLASAFIEGVRCSLAPYVAAMDGDLQHDERLLPDMLAVLRSGEADVVIGSRYVAGGGLGEWDRTRAGMSDMATRLSRLVLRTPVTDPMSGFFMLPRTVFERAAPRLSAIGFKILLDLLASLPETPRVRELPYTFRSRTAGESKLDAGVLFDFALLLVDKLIGGYVPVRFVMFAMIGALGLVAHLLVLRLGLTAGLGFSTAQAVATACAIVGNFVLNNEITFRDRRLKGARRLRGLIIFAAVCWVGAIANLNVASLMVSAGHQAWWSAGVVGAAMSLVWNYAVGSTLTWRR
jgi:dolichol-phosphate mannosyltransferase